MIPSPRRSVSQPAVHSNNNTWPDVDDDDGWQDMPVVRSSNPFDLDEDDIKKYHYQPSSLRLDPSSSASVSTTPNPSSGPTGNATGSHMELEGDTFGDSWREKIVEDESDYTRLRLNEDEESEEVAMRTKYLFDEDKAMTPLSQMQATKNLLTEGQRIAYVGLCQLIAKRMLREMNRGWEGHKASTTKSRIGLKGKGKDDVPVVESGNIWMLKIMARLYQHMDVSRDEQRMIESLAEHGVDPSDLVPALMTTHTVNNPDYDPKAKEKADLEAIAEAEEADLERGVETEKERLANRTQEEIDEEENPPPPYQPRDQSPLPENTTNPFGDDDDVVDESLKAESHSPPSPVSHFPPKELVSKPSLSKLPSFDFDEDDGDIGSMLSPSAQPHSSDPRLEASTLSPEEDEEKILEMSKNDSERTPKVKFAEIPEVLETQGDNVQRSEDETAEKEVPAPLPSLPGVSTSLSNTDEKVTLDIRWTVLCDLFLVLIADSVYDARSRAFLELVSSALGFEWLDLVRFENRVTDALEIQEGTEKTAQDGIIEGRKKAAKTKRYALMGLAAVGGGLVIGLSAGLAAPLIGAGIGAALGTVGITGTGTFLAGAGGIGLITTGGVLTGANIAGQGMARRTREVRVFQLKPLHNNKRVSCYITMGGFMASKFDDVRLPFSVLDPIIGDVYSILWEPEMMEEMGSAMKILTGEILTQMGQQVLAATVMTALMSALQWPIILTKLGYLIDNPWSNALDRARAAGLVLADTILNRHAGVRPISLIGYSLGARAIFYALIELARVKAYGLVQDVFIFGTTVTASKSTWLDVRSVVAGRFVNGYATNDWMLGYLFRATSGGLNTVAGLRPVETVAGLENVDVTDIITGHMSYRSLMPQLLAKVGFPVTAEYFDEPDDPNVDMSVQERRIVDEAEEVAKQNRRKILGIFPVNNNNKPGGNLGSGTSTPNPDKEKNGESSTLPTPGPGGGYEYEEDDDLPPREETDLGELPGSASSSKDLELEQEENRRIMLQRQEEEKKKDEEAMKSISKTAGFDFKAISQALGKDIYLDQLKQPEPFKHHSGPLSEVRIPLERSGSAPPPVVNDSPTEENTWSSAKLPSTSSFSRVDGNDVEDEGDITTSMTRGLSLSDLPSWEKPQIPINPEQEQDEEEKEEAETKSSSVFKSPVFSWNAWNSTSGNIPTANEILKDTPKPVRFAPPARPHPKEFINMNPFMSTNEGWGNNPTQSSMGMIKNDSDFERDKKRKEDEDEAETNPW
ncbi:uncharacterized protein I206_102684 [Kwoniella pini CBS 10737]|uniref:DUF726-domain-containing protein n=1 Tax=Kwoniella pini CBS 10737 TaxID=1296096 RepID=A0A1B9I622_9TREE|nr:uncharacterized protein I206_03037 [Kwoniella pini CBS 10737]OCF50975.1 hypothetical protein I206_03037 [Kwoniella pini CBS 10737]